MSNPNEVGKVFNLTGGSGGSGSLKLESLTVKKPPNKTTYKSGENFDPTGMVVEAGYGYGITSDVTGYTVTPSVLTDGVTEVTITYTEGRATKTASTPVTVEKVLVGIAVTTQPAKMAYDYLESFDPTGMAVTATFSDGSTSGVTGYTYSSTAFSTLGTQSVELSYTYEGVTKSTSLDVTVNAIEVAVPTQKFVPSYDNGVKYPVWEGYDSIKMTMSGTTDGINAGTYTAKFTLVYGYLFPNGTSEATADWVIGKGDNTMSVSPASLTLNMTAKSGKFTVTRKGSGTISATSSNTNVATVGAINQTTGEVTISSVNDTSGTATITFKVAEDSNYLAPANKTGAVTASFREYLYGFDITLSDSNPATRVSYPSDVENSAFAKAVMNFGAAFSYGGWPSTPGSKFMPRPCMLKYDGTVAYYLNPNDYTKKTDGTASDVANVNFGGNAMMEWPKIYVKRWESGGVYHFRCSDVKVDGDYECWSNYDKNSHEIPHFYTPIFFGSKDSSNRLRSISGQANMVSQTAQTEVTYAKNNGADIWYTEVAADRFLIQDLLVMMFKSTDLQVTAGMGVVSASAAIAPGTMNARGLFWGSNDKTSGVKVFGMENWWGNIWRRTAGWMLVNNEHKLKLTRGTKDGTTAADYNFDGTGYLATGAKLTANGYISSMKTERYGRLPIAASGSSTTFEADYTYQNSGTRYAVAGGRWYDGLAAGPFYTYLNYTPGYASTYLGVALSCKPLAAA